MATFYDATVRRRTGAWTVQLRGTELFQCWALLAVLRILQKSGKSSYVLSATVLSSCSIKGVEDHPPTKCTWHELSHRCIMLVSFILYKTVSVYLPNIILLKPLIDEDVMFDFMKNKNAAKPPE